MRLVVAKVENVRRCWKTHFKAFSFAAAAGAALHSHAECANERGASANKMWNKKNKAKNTKNENKMIARRVLGAFARTFCSSVASFLGNNAS